MQMSYAKLEITKTKHQGQIWNILEMHLMMTSRSLWISRKKKNTTKATATWMNVIPNL